MGRSGVLLGVEVPEQPRDAVVLGKDRDPNRRSEWLRPRRRNAIRAPPPGMHSGRRASATAVPMSATITAPVTGRRSWPRASACAGELIAVMRRAAKYARKRISTGLASSDGWRLTGQSGTSDARANPRSRPASASPAPPKWREGPLGRVQKMVIPLLEVHHRATATRPNPTVEPEVAGCSTRTGALPPRRKRCRASASLRPPCKEWC